jgi:hypothetical protein
VLQRHYDRADARPGTSVAAVGGVPVELLFDQLQAVIIDDETCERRQAS